MRTLDPFLNQFARELRTLRVVKIIKDITLGLNHRQHTVCRTGQFQAQRFRNLGYGRIALTE